MTANASILYISIMLLNYLFSYYEIVIYNTLGEVIYNCCTRRDTDFHYTAPRP